MTTLSDNNITLNDELEELLKINLPSSFKAGNDKETSNIKTYSSHYALNNCKFINFNSKERVSFMVFDIDRVGDKTALEYFKNIDGLYTFIMETIGLEPTYILRTQKGFHFAYHLKNHIYTNQSKPLEYLRAIKTALTALLNCDPNASHRLNGVWRNPLLHPFYYSGHYNYELSDFKKFLPKREFQKNVCRVKFNIDDALLVEGNRNKALFIYGMKYAKGRSALSEKEIFMFLEETNLRCSKPLELLDLATIAHSVYGYWEKGTIEFRALNQQDKNINEGVMEFPKMSGLSTQEYEAEVKSRQQLSAQRTNKIKNQDKAKNQLEQARERLAQKRQSENQKKVIEAIAVLERDGLKVSISAIKRITGMDRKTVGKYLNFYPFK